MSPDGSALASCENGPTARPIDSVEQASAVAAMRRMPSHPICRLNGCAIPLVTSARVLGPAVRINRVTANGGVAAPPARGAHHSHVYFFFFELFFAFFLAGISSHLLPTRDLGSVHPRSQKRRRCRPSWRPAWL